MSVYQNYKDYNEFKDFFENISDVLDLDSDDILECFDEILYNDYVDFVIVGADTLGSRWVSKKKENPWEIQAYLVSIFKFYDAIERDYNENVANKIKKLIQDQYGVEIEEDIEMNGYNSIAFMQGNQRTLKEILESNLDIDSLLEEFAEQYGYLKGE